MGQIGCTWLPVWLERDRGRLHSGSEDIVNLFQYYLAALKTWWIMHMVLFVQREEDHLFYPVPKMGNIMSWNA